VGLFRWSVLKLAGWMGLLKPRTYRVTLFGESLGTYKMPRGHHMANPEAEDRPVLTRPFRMSGADNFHIYWVEPDPEGGARVLSWSPETPDDNDAARRFYNGAHGLHPDGTPNPAKQPPLQTRTTEELRLIGAVLADPDTEQPYLEYAKWLGAKNDPYGEYIKLTLELEKLPEGDPQRERLEERRGRLVRKHGARWVRPLTDAGLFPGLLWFHTDNSFFPDIWYGKRGVIEKLDLTCNAHVFPRHAARLFYGAPFLRKLWINDLDITVADLVVVPQMAQIESLSLTIGSGTVDDFLRFAESPYLTGLRELELTGHDIQPESAVHLAQAKWLAGVRKLDLGINAVGDDGAEALAESPNVANLAVLGLGSDALTDRGLIALCRSTHLAKLTELRVDSNTFSAEGVRAIPAAPFAGSLTALHLNNCGVDLAGVEALAAGQFRALKSLGLAAGTFGAAGMLALAAAPWFTNLEQFTASNCGSGDAGAHALAEAGFLALRELDLADNGLTDAGVSALVRSKAATKLTKLNVSNNPFGLLGTKALAGTNLPALEELDLSRADIGRPGAQALAASPYLKNLKRLVVSEEFVGLIGREALIKRFTDQVVTCY
jgi:uncharacterized protein (TIGR02996 family)